MRHQPEEPDDDTEAEEVFRLYQALNAQLLGKLDALEVLMTLLLEGREDLAELAHRADEMLADREAALVKETGENVDFAMETHEWALHHLEAMIANAHSRFGRS